MIDSVAENLENEPAVNQNSSINQTIKQLFPQNFNSTLFCDNLIEYPYHKFNKVAQCHCCGCGKKLPIDCLHDERALPIVLVHRLILPYLLPPINFIGFTNVVGELNFIFNRNNLWTLRNQPESTDYELKVKFRKCKFVTQCESLPSFHQQDIFCPLVGAKKTTVWDIFYRIFYLHFYPQGSPQNNCYSIYFSKESQNRIQKYLKINDMC